MIRQKSFENGKPTLYLVATPIGNLNELTPRAIEVLKQVDVIAAEDTRTTMKLLSHFEIHTRCIAHHMHNEKKSAAGLLKLLEEGKNVALVSDAGYPLVSDPGQSAADCVAATGYNVVPISGANAMLNGLVASGLAVMPFYFKGFLANTPNQCRKECEALKNLECTLVFYEAPHRLTRTLQIFLEVFGDRRLTLARELTKKHEEFLRGTVSEILAEAEGLKGEMVLIVEGYRGAAEKPDEASVLALVEKLKSEGLSTSSAIKEAAKQTSLSKNEIYALVNRQS